MRKSVVVVLGLLVAGGTVSAQQYLITRVAGGGVPSTPALATATALEPDRMGAYANGNLYFTSNNCVFKVDGSGVLTRVAGSSALPGYSGDGGPATSAQLNINDPAGLAVDGAGNVYFADSGNHVIRKVAAATGIITTLAGSGTLGYSGDGGPATSAKLDHPIGLAVDAAGNLYFADGDSGYPDSGNNVIRKITAATGIITTAVGNGTPGYSGDGGPATSAQLNHPVGVAMDAAGNLYIADTFNSRIRKVAAGTGIITTVDGGGWNVAVDGSGNLYITDYSPSTRYLAPLPYVYEVPATGVNNNTYPAGVALAVDGAGNVYVSPIDGIGGDRSTIVKVAAGSGAVTAVAGNGSLLYSGEGGPATSAQFDGAPNVAVDFSGNLYIADFTRVLKVAAATGIITTVAGDGTQRPGDDSGDGGPATSARVYATAVAVDGSGNLYFGGIGAACVVRKVTAATGIITTVAGIRGLESCVYSGDGGPATSAGLGYIESLAVDGSGDLYIGAGSVVRKVTMATGVITRVAGVPNSAGDYSGDGGPATSAILAGTQGLAVDGSGNVYIADYSNNRIRKVTAATGIITTVAGGGTAFPGDGGAATSAELDLPVGVAVDGSGNIFINASGMIRKVVGATGIITTVAGVPNSVRGYSGDGGPATSAQLDFPQGLAVDGSGNIYFSDLYGIRMLVPVTRPLLSVTSTHSSNFGRVQMDASYSIVVSNNANAGPTSGTVTVTETLPAGLTLASMSGAGWNCSGAVCTREDALSPGASYAPILVTVNVALDAASQVTNQVLVSGGGSQPTGTTDLTTITGPPPAPVLTFPANGAVGVLVAPTLSWSGTAESFDVYFGTSSTPPLAGSAMDTNYAPAILNSGTTYYWQVVARNSFGSSSSAIWSFTTGVAATGSRFVPVAPCRVADTRRPGGPFGGPTMTARSMRSFAIPSSGCGIPASAHAYSLNVTVVPAGPLGFLTLWPAGQAQPVVSTLNSLDGIVVANAAIVPAGAGGAVSVFVTDQTDVILDINGYFDGSGASNSSSFYAAAPCRVADTRGTTGQFGGPALVTDQVRDFPVPLSSCGIPAAATAYSLNVTAIPGTEFLAYLTTFPTGASRPFVSTLNSWTGEVKANAALVPVGANDSVSVFVTDPANVILDINGYFGQPGGAGELSFYPLAPCRVVDTRGAAGAFGGPEMEAKSVRSFALPAGGCSVPSNAAAYSLNVTVVPDGVLSFLTAWPAGALRPLVSTLNSFDGAVVANAAIVPAGTNGAVSIYVTDRTQVILDINGYFAQ